MRRTFRMATGNGHENAGLHERSCVLAFERSHPLGVDVRTASKKIERKPCSRLPSRASARLGQRSRSSGPELNPKQNRLVFRQRMERSEHSGRRLADPVGSEQHVRVRPGESRAHLPGRVGPSLHRFDAEIGDQAAQLPADVVERRLLGNQRVCDLILGRERLEYDARSPGKSRDRRE
jgi:hypothetical protein